MPEKTAAEIRDLEYDWIASDADGHVAFFSTAGGGYAPVAFLRDTEAHDQAVDALISLPVRTEARFAPGVAAGRKNAWKLMAERGLFAFDSDPEGGPYRLVAAPRQPVRANEFPEVVMRAACSCRLGHIHFATATELLEEDLRKAEAGGGPTR